MAKKPPPIAYEAAPAELEQRVDHLEQGETTLEAALRFIAQGVILVRACQIALRQSEQKVEQLLERNGGPVIQSFSPAAG